MQRIWRFTRAPTREHHACVHVGIAAQAVRYILRTERLHLRVAPSLRVGPCKFKRGATRILAGGGPPTEMKSMDWDTGKCRDRGSDWERDRNREKDREGDSGGERAEKPQRRAHKYKYNGLGTPARTSHTKNIAHKYKGPRTPGSSSFRPRSPRKIRAPQCPYTPSS